MAGMETHPESQEVEIVSESLPAASSTLGRECPICLEFLTKVGLHRVVVTKCGHTFGKKCLLRCLEIKRECPTCRKTVRKRELIDLYDCDVVAVDNSKSETLRLELEEERSQKHKIEMENAKLAVRLGQMNYEILASKANEAKLQEEILHLKSVSSALTKQMQQPFPSFSSTPFSPHSTLPTPFSTLSFEYTWGVNDLSDARVIRPFCQEFDISTSQRIFDTLLVSGKQPDNRYSLQKISLEDSRHREMIGSYNAPIRDMCVSSHNGPSNLICITGNDKVASIFSGRTGQNVMKLSLGHHTGWSCCFDEANSSLIWVGASSGMIMLFDIRKMGGRVVSPTCPYDGSCLAAYQLAPDQPETNFFENIPNLIPKMSTQIYNIQMGYPPIQSLLHSRTDSNSICDHLMVCQGGRGRFLHLGGQLNTLNSSDICLPAGIPMSVYDIQRCVRPGSDIHAPCHYVLACRSQFLSAEQNKNLISPQPAFRTISFDPSMQRSLPNHSLPPHHKEMSSWRFDEGMTFTGHSASTSGAKPHSAFVGSQFMKSLLGAEYDETNKSLDSGLMIACPDEAHHGVLVSVAGGREIRKIGVIAGHGEPVRQVCLIPPSHLNPDRVLLASVSSSQLTLHTISTEQGYT